MLVIAKVAAMSAQPAAVVLVIVQVVCLMAVRLKGLVQVHLRLKVLVAGAAIDQAMVLPVVVVVVHGVRIVGGGVGARGAIRRGSICVRLE